MKFIIVVDGNWGNWMGWSKCLVDCGGGIRIRVCWCNYFLFIYGGKNCLGLGVKEEFCNEELCKGIYFFE